MLSNELSESASAMCMNVASGNIVICWLSCLPSSEPGGLDKASAAVCVFPGMCSNVK